MNLIINVQNQPYFNTIKMFLFSFSLVYFSTESQINTNDTFQEINNNYTKPAYCSEALVASSYSGQNQSIYCFWLLNKLCTQGPFWLVLTVKNGNSFWPVNVLTTCKIWQCSTFIKH